MQSKPYGRSPGAAIPSEPCRRHGASHPSDRAARGTPGSLSPASTFRATRCVPRRVLPSCPLAIPSDQPRTWKIRASTVRPAACCQPSRSRVTTAGDLAAVRLSEPDLPLQSPSSLIVPASVAGRAPELFAPRTRYAAATATAPAENTLSRACVPLSLDSHDCGHLLGNSFCAISSPAAPAVNLPYRDMPAAMACTYPHPQARSIRRSVSGLLQRTQLRVLKGCVHAH